MFQQIPVVAIVIATLFGASSASAEIRVKTQAIETSTAVTSLPDDNTGSIVVKACPSCSPLLLRLTPASKYRVGGTDVSFEEFRALASDAGSRNLVVSYYARERTIARLTLTGQSPPRRPVEGR